ncbi:MAG: hypothetical protein WCG01_02815 [bacterium]
MAVKKEAVNTHKKISPKKTIPKAIKPTKIVRQIAPEEPRLESLALISHLHAKSDRKPIKFTFSFLRLNAFLESNPSLWCIAWALLWRGFILIVLSKFIFSLSTSLLTNFLYNSFLKFL